MIPLNSHIFDVVELDSNSLTPQLAVVAQVGAAGRYRGDVTAPDGSLKTFALVVAPSPAEPSVNIDISQAWSGIPTYTVVENGYVVISVLSGAGGQTIRIYSDKEVLLDNSAFRSGQMLIVRVLRPGKHLITDKTGGGTCNLVVNYPVPGAPPNPGKADLQVNQVDATHTAMDPNNLTVSVTQAIVIHLQDKTHIVTTLLAQTDRIGDRLETRPVCSEVKSSEY
jgi:hypothetical protein